MTGRDVLDRGAGARARSRFARGAAAAIAVAWVLCGPSVGGAQPSSCCQCADCANFCFADHPSDAQCDALCDLVCGGTGGGTNYPGQACAINGFCVGPPTIDRPVNPGDSNVTGTGTPDPCEIDICLLAGSAASTPPCTSADTLLGAGTTDGTGQYNAALGAPLAAGECVYAFDTCSGLISLPACAAGGPPAPAPALGLDGMIFALGAMVWLAARRLSGRRM